jgi:hypothetical protein
MFKREEKELVLFRKVPLIPFKDRLPTGCPPKGVGRQEQNKEDQESMPHESPVSNRLKTLLSICSFVVPAIKANNLALPVVSAGFGAI